MSTGKRLTKAERRSRRIRTGICVAAIPVNALVEDGSRTFVYTSYDESTDTLGGLVEVETGISDGTLVEILSGLEAGGTVWYRYADQMNDTFFSR